MAERGGRSENRLLAWLNSIHAHLLALSIGVIAALTGVSLALVYVFTPPTRPPVSVYEMSRIVRHLPTARQLGELRESVQAQAPDAPDHEADRIVSALLAAYLRRPVEDVRVRLQQDRQRIKVIAREAALYSDEGEANPLITGTFSMAVREGDSWRVVSRHSQAIFDVWDIAGWKVILIGSLLTLPLTLWFSARLARPIKAFAASAQRLGGGRTAVEPVSLEGPHEIRLAAQSLNEMQGRIVNFVRERTTLLGAIAHDLRTPLARLRFHLEAAPVGVRQTAEEEIREMERLVGVILEFVENETRPQVREPLDLSMLVEGVADDFADLGKDVEVVASEPVTIIGDPLLLKRLFANIVDNALKYGRSACLAIRREEGAGVVEVLDSGRGMSDEELLRAFEPFYRGEPSRNRQTGGTGLGLSIVKSAADAHEGEVELANAPQGGLLVRVRLPIRGERPSDAAQPV